MLFESLEARRLMSVVAGNPASLYGIQATQSGSGTLTVKGTIANVQIAVFEAGSRNDTGGLIASYGAGAVGVIDVNGNEAIFDGLSAKPISIQGGGSGATVGFDGITHVANVNLGGGNDTCFLIDEGAGGSVIACGGAFNQVAVPFSHKVTINDGGGTNNIVLNSDFFADTAISGNVVSQTDWNESVILGDTSADLTNVNCGGGTNTIVDYAGNLKIATGGSVDTMFLQGLSGSVTNPPKTIATAWVDVISEKGIDQLIGF